MKILNISLDKNILDKDSAAAKRMVEYGDLVERYTILVLADRDQEFNLSDKVKVIAIRKSNKFFNCGNTNFDNHQELVFITKAGQI